MPPVGHDAARSMISGTKPCSRSARPSARPAIPPPTMRIRLGSPFLECCSPGQNAASKHRFCAGGLYLGLRFGEKPSAQAELAIDG